MNSSRMAIWVVLIFSFGLVCSGRSQESNKSEALAEIRPLLKGELSRLCFSKPIPSNTKSIDQLRQQLLADVEKKDFQTAFRKLNSGIRDLPENEIKINDLATSVLFLMKIHTAGPLSVDQIRFGKTVSKYLIAGPSNSDAAAYGFKFLQSMAYEEDDLRGLLSITKQASEKLTGNQPFVRSTLVELNQLTGLMLHRHELNELAMKSYLSNNDSEWTLRKLESAWRGYHLASELKQDDNAKLFLKQSEACPPSLQESPYHKELVSLRDVEPTELETYRARARSSYLPAITKALNQQKKPWFEIESTLPVASELSRQGIIQLMFQAANDPNAFRKLALLAEKPPAFVNRRDFYRIFVDFGSQIPISDPVFLSPITMAKAYSAMQLNDVESAKESYALIHEFLEANSIPNHRLKLVDELGLYVAARDEAMVDTSIERLVQSLDKRVLYPTRDQKVLALVELMGEDAKWDPQLESFLNKEIPFQKNRSADANYIATLELAQAKSNEAQKNYADAYPGMNAWFKGYTPSWWDETEDRSQALTQYLNGRVASAVKRQNDNAHPISTFHNFVNRASKTLTYTERLKSVLRYASSGSGSEKENVAAFSAATSSILDHTNQPAERKELRRVIDEIPHVTVVESNELKALPVSGDQSRLMSTEKVEQRLGSLIAEAEASATGITDPKFSRVESLLSAGNDNINTSKVSLAAINRMRLNKKLTESQMASLDKIERNLKFKTSYYEPIIGSVLAVYPKIPIIVEANNSSPKLAIQTDRNNELVRTLNRFSNGSLLDFQIQTPLEVLQKIKQNSPKEKQPAIAKITLELIESQFIWMQGWQSAINFDSLKERQLITDLLDRNRIQGDRSKAERTRGALQAQLDFDSGQTPNWSALDFTVLIDRKMTILEAKLAHLLELGDTAAIGALIRSADSAKFAEIRNRPTVLLAWQALGNSAAVDRTIKSMRSRIESLLLDEVAGFDRNGPLLEVAEMMSVLPDYGIDLVPESLVTAVKSKNPWQKGRAEFLINYYLGKKDYQSAIKLAEDGVELFNSTFYLTQLARAHHLAGNAELARSTAHKYLNNHGHGHWHYNSILEIAALNK